MSGGGAEERRGRPMTEIRILNGLPPSVRGEQVAQTRATLVTLIGAPTASGIPKGRVSLAGSKEGRTTPRKGAGGRLGGGAGGRNGALAAAPSLLSLGLEYESEWVGETDLARPRRRGTGKGKVGLTHWGSSSGGCPELGGGLEMGGKWEARGQKERPCVAHPPVS